MKSFKYFQNITKKVKDFQECNSLICHCTTVNGYHQYVQFSPNWPVGESYEESGPWLEAMDGYIKVVNKQRVNLFCYSLVAYKRSLVG